MTVKSQAVNSFASESHAVTGFVAHIACYERLDGFGQGAKVTAPEA